MQLLSERRDFEYLIAQKKQKKKRWLSSTTKASFRFLRLNYMDGR